MWDGWKLSVLCSKNVLWTFFNEKHVDTRINLNKMLPHRIKVITKSNFELICSDHIRLQKPETSNRSSFKQKKHIYLMFYFNTSGFLCLSVLLKAKK